MAKKFIRDEIINTARRLFNRRGYSDVSMRDIADALSISVGNLTYHFGRKEDVLLAVVEETHRYRDALPLPQSLPQLNALLARMQNDIQQNAFYFWHHGTCENVPAPVVEKQTALLQEHFDVLCKTFASLCENGQVVAEAYNGHYCRLAQAVQALYTYWVPYTAHEVDYGVSKDLLDCVWGALFPVLTDEGRQVYAEKIVKVRMVFD